MAAVAFPVPGKLYLTPTAVTGSSGTLLDAIDERNILIAFDADVRERLTGWGTSAGPRSRMGQVREARLLVPLRKQDTTGLKLYFPHLTTDGTTMRPTGGTAALAFAKLPTFAIILRPDSTGEKYVYSPNWAIARGSAWAVNHGLVTPQMADGLLELIATRPTSATGPAFGWSSSANIASMFSLSES